MNIELLPKALSQTSIIETKISINLQKKANRIKNLKFIETNCLTFLFLDKKRLNEIRIQKTKTINQKIISVKSFALKKSL